MATTSVPFGGGPRVVAAGYFGMRLRITTIDRENMEGATFTITGNGNTYTATSDEGGHAYIEVPSGYTYTVTLTHNGQYEDDLPQKVVAKSAAWEYVHFDLYTFEVASALILVTTYPGSTVTATNASSGKTITATADSLGLANLYGVIAGDTWDLSVNGETTSVLIEHYLTSVTLGMMYDVTIEAVSGTTVSGSATTGETFSFTMGSTGIYTLPLLSRTWTITAGALSETVTVTAATTVDLKIYTYTVNVAIATTDPEDRCTYADDAVGLTPASGTSINGWDGCKLLSGIKPVRLYNGEFADLSKTNPAYLADGTTASNIGTTGYDAFTEVETWWLSITSDGTTLKISFSNAQLDDTYQKYASTWNGSDVGMFHIGMFFGYTSSSKLYSQGGTSPAVNTTLTNFISYAQARGDGYDLTDFYQWTYLQALFVLLYRSTNSQSALGAGYTGGSAVQTNAILTYDNDYGMYGSSSTTTRMSFLWINDFWGNAWWWLGGAKTNSSRQLMTIIGGLASTTESDFTVRSTTAMSSNISGYISGVSGTTETGFFPQAASGSATTYWCDNCNVDASYFPVVGGSYLSGAGAGAFYAYFNNSASGSGSRLSARLSYRAGRQT